MAKKNKLARRIVKDILAGIDAANDEIRHLGAQACYPSHVEYYEDYGDYIIRGSIDVEAWLENQSIVITNSKKEVKGGG